MKVKTAKQIEAQKIIQCIVERETDKTGAISPRGCSRAVMVVRTTSRYIQNIYQNKGLYARIGGGFEHQDGSDVTTSEIIEIQRNAATPREIYAAK